MPDYMQPLLSPHTHLPLIRSLEDHLNISCWLCLLFCFVTLICGSWSIVDVVPIFILYATDKEIPERQRRSTAPTPDAAGRDDMEDGYLLAALSRLCVSFALIHCRHCDFSSTYPIYWRHDTIAIVWVEIPDAKQVDQSIIYHFDILTTLHRTSPSDGWRKLSCTNRLLVYTWGND